MKKTGKIIFGIISGIILGFVYLVFRKERWLFSFSRKKHILL